MSDHWEFYPCRMDEHPAYIFYDHGIRESINDLDLPHLRKIRALFKHPTGNGLPTNDEFEALSELEDLIGVRIEHAGGRYIGRVTVAGARYFHCFGTFDERTAAELLEHLRQATTYSLDFALKPDPEKSGYWDDLFPSAEEWRVIQDMKVLDVLKEHGDDPSIARRIDHWLYFGSEHSRDRFQMWAENSGFFVEGRQDGEGDEPYGLQIYQEAHPTLADITAITGQLVSMAQKLEGTYDGWETSVEVAADGLEPGA
jgi:regulator of RNase E activity RraB